MPSKQVAKVKDGFRILEEADVPVGELIDDQNNSNTHPPENLAAIEASLRAFGQVERLVVRQDDNIVFAGNGRLQCLRKMGTTTARVQFVSGSDVQCRSYALAANQTTRMSRFDEERLAETLQELAKADADGGLLEASGFTPEDITDLLEHLEVDAKKQIDKLPRGKGGTTATCPDCGTQFQVGKAK